MRKLPFISGILVLLFCFLPLLSQTSGMKNEDCLTCHSDKELTAETERGKGLNLHVPEDALRGSVHEGMACTDCHTGAKSFEDIPHSDKPLTRGCTNCHEEAMKAIENDVHGVASEAGNPRAPYCSDCHGGHQVVPLTAPDSILSKTNQPDTCGKCHGGEDLLLEEKGITKRNLVGRYKSSVHWEAIVMGKNAATCTDCHGHHGILSSASEKSGVSRVGVANSCQKCHTIETKSFWTGAHGSALLHGNNDVPNCTTCHGDHDMASLRSRVGDAKQWASTQVCIWCHGNSRMMARYGLDTTPVDSYMEDFHGLTQRGTAGASATCSDCHDPHHSLPAGHPSSRMHISNRGPACAKCHGKVTDSFAQSFSHRKALKEEGGELANIIRVIYIILIVVTVGGMTVYSLMVWLWAVRKKIKNQRNLMHVNRMSRFERSNHFILFITFSILVLTGFMLKFPESFWVKWLFAVGIDETIRSFIHRLSAMTMTISFIFFAFYMFFRKRGKCLRRAMYPRFRDITDAFKTVKFYLGLSQDEHPPKYAVFNFAEKVEFWALVWGTIVMVVTGLILWFPKALPEGSPFWVIPVARVIHFFEAVLATLAIIIWHGFHTILHPDEYPMNTSWLTGYITKEEARHHFEDEAIAQMQKSAKAEEKEEK